MEAQADCEKWGGNLVPINTEEELLFIKGIIRDHFIKSIFRHENVFYIGLVRDSKVSNILNVLLGIYGRFRFIFRF